MNPPGTPALEGSSRVPRAKPEGMGKEGAAKEGVGDAGSWKSPWQETHPRRQHRRHREAEMVGDRLHTSAGSRSI